MKTTIVLLISILGTFHIDAQDLSAHVQVNTSKIRTTNTHIFTVLQNDIRAFLNERKWSDDVFLPQERIACTFLINITAWDGSSSSFAAEAQIQASRPVYGSSYNTTVLNITDKHFSFDYTVGQSLDYSEQSVQSNLSLLLAYYAYIILGLDYDTFSELGGTSYFSKAQTIVTNAQNTAAVGWGPFDNKTRNRYWLANNLNDGNYAVLRKFLYRYHRALDVMATDVIRGRNQIFTLLPDLLLIDRQATGEMLSSVLLTAKSNELIAILSKANLQERLKAFEVLSTVDPGRGFQYQVLIKP